MAEGGGLLNRYTLQRRIEGSNPSGSASLKDLTIRTFDFRRASRADGRGVAAAYGFKSLRLREAKDFRRRSSIFCSKLFR